MLAGQYHHQLDHKGRVSVPKKFRQILVGGGLLTRGLDGCLFMYSHEMWESLAEKLKTLPMTARDARAFSRFLLANAIEVSYDKLGRIAIPTFLSEAANVKSDVTFVGVGDRVEIWSSPAWKAYQETSEPRAAEIAEKLTGPEFTTRI
jgi:MraZ protein